MNIRALLSVLVAGALALVATIRLLSYYRGALGLAIRNSFVGFLAYQPDTYYNVRYFKILASLSFVSFIYFVFRAMNRSHRRVFPPGYESHHRDLDFKSPRLRLVIVAIVSAHWVIQEAYKFTTRSYPYSPIESWESNAIVLVASGVIAFFGMKYLSFEPLFEK